MIAGDIHKHIENWRVWQRACASVLYGNLLDQRMLRKLRYHYSAPAKEKGHYLPQWLWDACFHALAFRWFDPSLAWDELLSLTEHQVHDRSDPNYGMIPHMRHLSAADATRDQSLFRHLERSVITQPPLIAIAALRVYETAPDDDHLQQMFAALCKYHAWFDSHRTPDDDHLVAILHPWEMGWDASQRWDSLMGVQSGSREELRRLADKRKQLVGVLYDCNFDAEAMRRREDGFFVKPADFNAIRAADLLALAEIARILGKTDDRGKYTHQARLIQAAIREKMVVVENDHIHVHDLIGRDEQRISPDSASKFILLLGECLTGKQAEMLRDELLAEHGPFATPYAVSSVAVDHLTFDGDEYWRGNVWMSVNWLIYTGLRDSGFYTAATQLAANSLDLVEKSGFREFFNPITGEGGKSLGEPCPQYQSWTTVVLDMLGTEK